MAVSQCGSMETQGVKYIFQYFLSQLYRLVIILYIKCGHQGAAINMRGIETAFERSVDRVIVSLSLSRFTIAHTLFILWSGSTYHTFYKIRCLSVVLRICKSLSSSSVISYSVYVVREILCTKILCTKILCTATMSL